jgi:hypothetical protein
MIFSIGVFLSKRYFSAALPGLPSLYYRCSLSVLMVSTSGEIPTLQRASQTHVSHPPKVPLAAPATFRLPIDGYFAVIRGRSGYLHGGRHQPILF